MDSNSLKVILKRKDISKRLKINIAWLKFKIWYCKLIVKICDKIINTLSIGR